MKKILWLVNISLPEVSKLMNKDLIPFGGWLVGLSQELSKTQGLKLTIVFPEASAKEIKKYSGENIDYYCFKPIKNTDRNNNFKKILDEVKPDIVHIHGTEFGHSLAMMTACKEKNIEYVVSIQGLVSVYAKHMRANLPFKVIYGMTIRNILLKDSVKGMINQFKKRGESEIKIIESSKNFIGRTDWDFACINQINSKVNYYFCNENLRDIFYERKWDINLIEKNSIFLSQGQYSIKGLHYMIEALPLVLEKYPNTKVYVAGKDILSNKSLKDKILRTYYAKYIKSLIQKNGLESKVIFTGALSDGAMCEKYLNSHVFVCPSTIENSPNSLGEAMLLGVPCITTNVGGIQNMLIHQKEGFIYQTDAPYMLAHYICKIFSDDDLALKLSNNSREKALITHDRQKNLNTLIDIYEKIGG